MSSDDTKVVTTSTATSKGKRTTATGGGGGTGVQRRVVLPRDAESKNLYAQRYRLLQERMSFIASRHRNFYIAQIVDRYPTPRFPYIDQRNIALWQEDQEERRHTERILQEAKRRVYDEICTRIVAQELRVKKELERAKSGGEESKEKEESTSSSSSSEKKKPGRPPGRPKKDDTTAAQPKKQRGRKKVMNIEKAETEEVASVPAAKQTRSTLNSLTDALSLETALHMSEVESSSAAAASSTAASSSTPAQSPESALLSSVSFARTSPLLRVGNVILYDDPHAEEWETAKIVSVNKKRTRMQIVSVTIKKKDSSSSATPTNGTKKKSKNDVSDDDDMPLDTLDTLASLATPTVPARWIDLDSAHFYEYVDVVWAKIKGFDWWPAELIDEVDCGQLVNVKPLVHIAFCEDSLTLQQLSEKNILPYFDYCEVNVSQTKLRKKGFEDSYNAAEEVWKVHMKQSMVEENARRLREAAYLHTILSNHPTFYLGKRVTVYWPLDTAWYGGVIKQYNVSTKKHCILYDDDAVEWIDVKKEQVAFATFPLSVADDAEVPINPTLVKQLYKTYLYPQFELKETAGKDGEMTLIGRDFLPDYIPRTVEQVDSLKDVVCDPKDAKLIAAYTHRIDNAAASSNTTLTTASTSSPSIPTPQLDLSTLNCWECGLDLERWNGPGLLSKKYGGTNKRGEDEGIGVISCGRCTKVVHAFCLRLMAKRRDQTEHQLLPSGEEKKTDENTSMGDANGGTTNEPDAESSDPVLPPHLSCTFKNPRCPDCLRCEHCFRISNKLASVEDLVTCDVCHIRVHLQCIDPAFDAEKNTRPTEGWVCPVCVQCRCCGATHSKGGKSTLPPLPPPPNENEAQIIEITEEKQSNNEVTATTATSAAADTPSSTPMDLDANEIAPAPTIDTTSDSTAPAPETATHAVSTDATDTEMTDAKTDSSEGQDVPAGGDYLTTGGLALPGSSSSSSVAAVSVPPTPTIGVVASAAPTPASAPKRKPKRRAQNWNKKYPPPAGAAAAAAAAKKPAIPFSKRFTSKWVDSDEESLGPERDEEIQHQNNTNDDGAPRKKVKLDANGNTGVVKFAGPDTLINLTTADDGPDRSFWDWTNSFTVCQPCGYRLEKRKYCPICVVIYDRHTTDPMVQCDSCQRWVHIECDPNAQANEDKLTKDNTQYHCSECLRRERSNELTSLLDDLVSHDKSKLFLHPVNEKIAPDYFLTIKTPMDFTTVYKKLMELQYQEIDQFKYDLNLIWRNAKDYNPAQTAIHRSAVRLQNRSMELFKDLAAKHGSAGGLFDQTIGRIEDEEEEKKKAEVEKEQKEMEAKRKKALKRQAEMQLPRQPRLQDYYSFFVSFDDIQLAEYDTCLLCGSLGDEVDFVFCIDCGECAHSWCYSSACEAEASGSSSSAGGSANVALNGEIHIDTSQYTRLTPEQKSKFRCPNCAICNQCGQQEKRVKVHTHVKGDSSKDTQVERIVDDLLSCSQCNGISHISCVPYLFGRRPTRNLDLFKCPSCIICRCCQSTTAGRQPTDRWSPDYTLCASCYKLYQAGNVCPVCDMVYKPRDESTPMMCCDSCQCWIHMQCDGLTHAQYIQLTADASKKYFCATCRSGTTPQALAARTEKDQARRLQTDRRKQERNKLNQHIGFIPAVLPKLQTDHDLMFMIDHTFERIAAAQCRILAMQRWKATALMNQTILTQRAQRQAISPLEAEDITHFERQANTIFQLISSVSQQNPLLRYDISQIPSPGSVHIAGGVNDVDIMNGSMKLKIEEDVDMDSSEVSPIPPTKLMVGVKKEEPATVDVVVKEEPKEDAPTSTATAADTKMVDVAPMTPTLSSLAVKREPPASASSQSSHQPHVHSLTHQSLSAEVTLSYLQSESLHASRKGDWRICAFCHKVGDQESPRGEGRLLPALCVGAKWVHVQCALWSDRVSTTIKGQMNVMNQIGKGDSLCAVCSLPGASLKCKRGYATCGKYHFACALSRECLFTSDKEFHCEVHAAKLKRSREATIDKIARRLVVANSTWNRFGLFAMKIREVQPDQKALVRLVSNGTSSSSTDDMSDALTREQISQQESMLSEYYSDYEHEGDHLWKRRKLSFASKATLKAEAEAAHGVSTYPGRRGRGGEDDEEVASRPILGKTEREAFLRVRHAKMMAEIEAAAAVFVTPGAKAAAATAAKEAASASAASTSAFVTAAVTHDSDEEPTVKEEPCVKEEDAPMVDTPEPIEEKSSAPRNSRSRSTRHSIEASDYKTRRRPPTQKQKEQRALAAALAAAASSGVKTERNKELDRLIHALPSVSPSSTDVFLRIGALSVLSLGELVPQSHWFHDAEYLYPLGYVAKRLFWSSRHPGQRTVYTCEIVALPVADAEVPRAQLVPAENRLYSSTENCSAPHRLVPVFRITAADDPTPLLNESAPKVWHDLIEKRFPSWLKRNSIRPRMRSGDTWCWSLGGSAFFGLSMKQVVQQIEMMPGAEECRKYKFKQIQRMIDAQKQQAEEREAERIRAGKSEEEWAMEHEHRWKASSMIAASSSSSNAVPSSALVAASASAASSASSSSFHLPSSLCSRTNGYDRRTKPVAARTGPGVGPSLPASGGAFSSITIVDDEVNGARRRKSMLQSGGRDTRPLKEVPLLTQYRIMKASAPRARVAHSVIHEWGLFANQDLEEGAMVIEYLGELIRPRIADLREKYYEDTGVDSCYMFRIDDDHIVDSTKRGNISRFINHSCDPNCVTECIETPNGKKIVVLATRVIPKDAEVTYDYFFASEDERIRCNCGAPTCAGRLN